MFYYLSEWRAGDLYKGNTIKEMWLNYVNVVKEEDIDIKENDVIIINGSSENNLPVFGSHRTEELVSRCIKTSLGKNYRIYYLINNDILNARAISKAWLEKFKKNIIIVNEKTWFARRIDKYEFLNYPPEMLDEVSETGNIESPTQKTEHFYSCLNDKFISDHRLLLIDVLCELDLLKVGNVSALFKFYDNTPTEKVIEYCRNKKITKCWDIEYLPFVDYRVYNNSWIDIVSETHYESYWNTAHITEKTMRPLVLGKPFLVAGQCGLHDQIKRLGFELYDEIFNYEFDHIKNHRERFKTLLENLIIYKDISVTDRKKLTEKVHEKIIHNNNLAKDLLYNPKKHMYVVDKSQDVFDTDESIIDFLYQFLSWDV